MNRRTFISQSVVTAGVVAGLTKSAFAQSSTAVVETAYGKIRGRVVNKVNAFQGIPYGGPTDGANRFMPPSKPKAWTSVLDTVEWGPEAPQGPHTEIPEVAATIPKTGISEDCLRLNVWTTKPESECETSGHGLAARRRIHERKRKLHDVQRREHGAPARRRHAQRQPPAEFLRVSVSPGDRRSAIREGVERGHSRCRRGAGMGARQHRQLRRRSRITSRSWDSPAARAKSAR